MALATLSIDLEARLAKLEEGLTKATRVAEKNAAQMERAFVGVGNAAKGVRDLLGTVFAGVTFDKVVFGTIDAIDALNDLKDATGSSIENLSALEDVARRNGGSLQNVSDILIKFNKTLKDVKPSDDAAQIFKQLGLDAEELKRLDPSEALLKTALAFDRFADSGSKGRAILALTGKSAAEAAPYLKDLAEKGELVGTVTTKQAEEAEKFNKQLFALKTNAADVARALISDLVPALNKVFERAKDGGFLALFGFDKEFDEKRKLAGFAAEVIRLDSYLKKLQNDKNSSLGFFPNLDKQIADTTAALEKAKAAFREARSMMSPSGASAAGAGRGFINPELASPPKPVLKDIVHKPEKAPLDRAKKQYDDLIASINERISATNQELESGEKLTESQRFALDVVGKLAATEVQLTDAQKRGVTTALESFLVTSKQLDQQRERTKLILDESRALTQITSQRVDENRGLSEQISEIGRTSKEIDKLRIARLEDAAAAEEEKLAAMLLLDPLAANADQVRENIRLLREQVALRKSAAAIRDAIDTSPLEGAQRAVDQYLEHVREAGRNTHDAVANAIEGLEDTLTEFVTTGKADFKGLVNSIIAEMIRLQVIKPMLSNLFSSGSIASLLGLFTGVGMAKGGAWNGGIQFYAKGDVFDAPTMFGHSKGLGVLGESGPEAVMPLKRGRDGKLGVSGSGGGVTVIQHISIGAGVNRNELMAAMSATQQSTINAIADAKRRGNLAFAG